MFQPIASYSNCQDLDQSFAFSFPRRTDYRDNTNKITAKFQSNPSQFQSHFKSSSSTPKRETKARESQVSRLDQFSRLNASSVEGLATFQHNVQVRPER